jgi:hypothetical protein
MPTATFVLAHDEVPASLNKGGAGSRRHWSAGAREKKRWEGLFFVMLLSEKVPKGASHIRVRVDLEFTAPARRDSENFRPAFSKPFADALVKGGWLADDTDEFFTLESVRCSKQWLKPKHPGVKGRTTIVLEADYEEPPMSFDRTQVGS